MKMQRILILIILIGVAEFAAAQSPVSTRQLRFYPVLTASDTTANNANRGRMWYDAVSQEFRFNSDGNNRSIGGGGSGGGGLNTASNGLTATGSDVALGGALTGNTTISGAFNLDFTNTATRFNSSNFQIWNPARTFKYTFAGGAITADRTITLPVISGNRNLMTVSNSSLNRIPYATNNSGDFVGSANFTFDGTTFRTPNITSNGVGNFQNSVASSSGEIRIYEPSISGSNYVSFISPSLSNNLSYTLPDELPSTDGQVLSSTISGVQSWIKAPIVEQVIILNSADIRNCGTTPITLIASPGGFSNINVISIAVKQSYVPSAYDFAAGEIPQVEFSGATGQAWRIPIATANTAGDFSVRLSAINDTPSNYNAISQPLATALVLTTDNGGNASNGSSAWTFTITYTIE